MKICVAQTKPIRGDIPANIRQHIQLVKQAIELGADVILFPELSLTGYEPALAAGLVMELTDDRLQPFQELSDAHSLVISVGLPTYGNGGISISLLLFIPHQPKQVYAKQYLHPDEEPFFVPGTNPVVLTWTEKTITFAICYEVFVPEHALTASQTGSTIYMASVAKSANGIRRANKRLAQIAADFRMTVLLANSVGNQDNFVSAGCSAVWNSDGELIEQLADEEDKLLLVDV